MKASWKLVIVEIKLFLRQPTAVFFTMLFPILLLGVFGAIYGNEPTDFFNNNGYVDTVCPAFIGLIMAMTGFTIIPGVVASYRERGVLKRLRASPISANTVLFTWITVYTVVSVLAVILMVIFGKLVFDVRFAGSWGLVILFGIISMVSTFSLGFIIAGLAPSVRTAEAVGMGIYFPMIFLSGTTIPVEVMPETLRQVTLALPLRHVVKLMQGLWFGGQWQDYWVNIVVIVGLAGIGVLVSALTFKWE